MKSKLLASMALVMGLSLALIAQGDTVWLASGGVAEGRITLVDGAGVVVRDGSGGSRTIAWSDVTQVRSTTPVTLTLLNGDRVTGTIDGIVDGRLQLLFGSEGWMRVGPNQLGTPTAAVAEAAPAPEKAPEKPPVTTPLEPTDWKGKIALSSSIRSGNVDSLLVAFHAEAQRNWEEDKLLAILDAIYGDTEGERTAESLAARLRYEHFFNRTFYFYAQADGLHDEIQSIDLRVILGVGIGDMLWKVDDDRFWSVEAGISGIYESYTTDEDSELSPAVRLATQYRNILFDALKFEQLLEVLFPLNDFGRWIGRSLTVLSIPVSESMRLRASLELNYQADPPGDTDNLDILSLIGLEYSF